MDRRRLWRTAYALQVSWKLCSIRGPPSIAPQRPLANATTQALEAAPADL